MNNKCKIAVGVVYDNVEHGSLFGWLANELPHYDFRWITSVRNQPCFDTYFVLVKSSRTRRSFAKFLVSRNCNVLSLPFSGPESIFDDAMKRGVCFQVFNSRVNDLSIKDYITTIRNVKKCVLDIRGSFTSPIDIRLMDEISMITFIMNNTMPSDVKASRDNNLLSIELKYEKQGVVVSCILMQQQSKQQKEFHNISLIDTNGNRHVLKTVVEKFDFMDRFGASYIKTIETFLKRVELKLGTGVHSRKAEENNCRILREIEHEINDMR